MYMLMIINIYIINQVISRINLLLSIVFILKYALFISYRGGNIHFIIFRAVMSFMMLPFSSVITPVKQDNTIAMYFFSIICLHIENHLQVFPLLRIESYLLTIPSYVFHDMQ